MAADLVLTQIASASAVGVGVRIAQARGAGTDRTVDAQVAGQAGRPDPPGALDRCRTRQLSPVADDAESQLVGDLAHPGQVLQRPEMRPTQLVQRGDALTRSHPECRRGGGPPLVVGEQPVQLAAAPVVGRRE